MQPIEINGRVWTLGDEIGKGGFGHVFHATADDGSEGAVKFVPKAPGADRELLFESLVDIPNVIPILGTAETEEFHVLLMPIAEESLRQYLSAHPGPVPVDDALPILTDLAEALRGLDAA
ncbi:MAG TPA: protein kinase, partial [Dehalococcoidia bacterium]|nr:protein kinase [Dehalococcoidia bacterium]